MYFHTLELDIINFPVNLRIIEEETTILAPATTTYPLFRVQYVVCGWKSLRYQRW